MCVLKFASDNIIKLTISANPRIANLIRAIMQD
jgi:hypothetical protein